MANNLEKRNEITPAPYGRWPDGTPITQIEASAKQMDDWASRHGFSGSVRMGIGTQHDDPKEWRGVKIGKDEALASPKRPPLAPPIQPVEITDPTIPVLTEIPPPPKPSLLARFMNWFKGDR